MSGKCIQITHVPTFCNAMWLCSLFKVSSEIVWNANIQILRVVFYNFENEWNGM